MSASVRYLDTIEQSISTSILARILKEKRRLIRRGEIKVKLPWVPRNEKEFSRMQLELWENLREFWKRELKPHVEYLSKYESPKSAFLRPDLYRPPLYTSVLSRTALYAEKVIMVDPVRYVEIINRDGKLCLGRKFLPTDTIFLLALRDWVEEGLVEIIPQPELWDMDTRRILIDLIDADARMLSETVTPAGAVGGPVNASDESIMKSMTSYRLASKLNSVLFVSEATHAYPTTDWGEDFYYWQWKLEREKRDLALDTKIIHALNNFPLTWFRVVPLDLLVEIRRKGILADLRYELRRNFADLSSAKSSNIEDVAKRCQESLEVNIKRMEEEWKSIRRIIVDKVTFGSAAAVIAGTLTSLVSTNLSIPGLYSALLAGTVGGGITAASLSIAEISTALKKRRAQRRNPLYFLFKVKEKSSVQSAARGQGVSWGYATILSRDYDKTKLMFEDAYLEALRSAAS